MKAQSQPRSTEVLVIVCAGVVLASLDLFVVNVALPQLAIDLHTADIGLLSWVLNAYAIVYAALLVFFGRLADRHRRDRAFLLGVAVFTAASIGCAASANLPVLIAFRVVQAAGAALLTPTSLALLLASVAPQRRSSAVRAWTAVGGAAAALGPVAGGLLVAVNWRWIFLINVPIGVAALIVGALRLPAVPGHPGSAPGVLGVLLATLGTGALTLGLVQGREWGWGSVATMSALATAVVLLSLFVVHCRRARSPLIDPGLFRARSFTAASVVSLVFSIAFGAMLLSRVLWQQDVWGWSPLLSGLGTAPGPLMVPLVAFTVAGPLAVRFGPGRVIAAGCVVFALGALWWAVAADLRPNYFSGVLGGMLLTGIGVGLTLPTTMAAGTSSLPPNAYATGSAVVNMLRQTGIALGVAMVVAIVAGHGGLAAFDVYRTAWWATAVCALVAVVPALAVPNRRAGDAVPTPSPALSRRS